ncbi:MAG: hypothetical protein ABIG34_04500 [Candidatus Peregrinibacteria bacterium]
MPKESLPQRRSPAEMDALLEMQRRDEKGLPLADVNGNVLCSATVNKHTGAVHAVRPLPFTDTNHGAESSQEVVCPTDEHGHITSTTMTRAEARETGTRYLVVSTLLFHNDEMLVQRRSSEKDLDPNMKSLSAHGVAKMIVRDRPLQHVRSIDALSMINSALELNEELRYGPDAQPFNVIVWPGTAHELQEWTIEKRIDDPNTVYLIPLLLDEVNGYPLGSTKQKRSRALSAGFIFSATKPTISIDPAEVSDASWKKASTFSDDPSVTLDAQGCIDVVCDSVIHGAMRDGSLGLHLAKRGIRNLLSGKEE